MCSTKWKKSFGDLWQNKGKSIAVILSITISTLCIGLVLISYSILEREMTASFLKAKPHAFSFKIGSFDDELMAQVEQHPMVSAVEARRVISSRIKRGYKEWVPMLLFVLRDYEDIALDVVEPEKGSWPPAEGEILLERQSISILGGNIGETVTVKTQQNFQSDLVLSGLAYDVVLPQAAMERVVYAYISSETLQNMGFEPFFNELSVGLSEKEYDLVQVKDKANDLEAWIKEEGYQIISTDIPIPGKHPHDQITGGMFIIQKIFGVLCCLLCGILVFNLISAIMSSQLQQIGVMKALGAKSRQIVNIYFGGVLGLGLAGLFLSLPFSILAGKYYSKKLAVMMNFDIMNDAASSWTYLVIFVVGLGIPLIAASFPIWKASRISIREAFVEHGVRQINFGRGIFGRLLKRIPFFSRPVLISLRNTFRKKGRLILTISILSMAAALYMSAVNLESTVEKFINNLQQTKAWGLKLKFERPYSVNELTRFLSEIQGIREVEAIWYDQADIINAAGEKQLSLPLTCVEPETKMLKYPYLTGNWLTGKPGEIIVNQYVANRLPGLKVGDEIRLEINSVSRKYRVLGIIESPGSPIGYLDYNQLVLLNGQKNLANGFYVNGANHEENYLGKLKQEVEKRMAAGNFEIASLVTAWQGFESLKAHFDIVFVFILVVTLLLILIGVNAIALSMRANILERTREIGVIKAIGASKGLLYKILVNEGVVIGLLSWLAAVVLSIPISNLVAIGFGQVLLRSSMSANYSINGIMICLVGAVTISALSCLIPARSIANLSVREALLYE